MKKLPPEERYSNRIRVFSLAVPKTAEIEQIEPKKFWDAIYQVFLQFASGSIPDIPEFVRTAINRMEMEK